MLQRCSKWIPVLALAVSGVTHADPIDDFVNEELTRQRIPGAALGIMHRGQLVRAAGYGFANVEHRVPVHPDTVFQTGSIGKQFTAAAVMLLVEDGKVRLDESIRTYLPKAPKTWQPITVRHMLNHTAGFAWDPPMDLRKDYSDDELLDLLYKVKLDSPAGARWGYSNTGYVLLGLMIRKVGGEPYGDVLAKRVFGPLQMTTARVISDRDIVPNRAAGYEVTATSMLNQEWVSPTANSTADGSLYLTLLDYSKWNAALDDGSVLAPESWAEVYRPAPLNSGKSYPYACGWFLESGQGRVHHHGGSWQGFETFFIRYLEERISIVVLTNSSSANPEVIARGVAALYEPRLKLPPGMPIEDREPEVAERLTRLIGQLANGKPDGSEFRAISPEDLKGYGEFYRAGLQLLGELRELRLFRRSDMGDDALYLYRARFSNGLMEAALQLDPGAKVTRLKLRKLAQWDDPLPPG